MKQYHKIQSIYKRDLKGKFLTGQWSTPELYYLSKNIWRWSEKIDGTNIRVGFGDGAYFYKGKTDNAQMPPRLLKALEELLPEKKVREVFEGDFCLYGEGCGFKIQKGGGNYYPDSNSFVLFDVKIGHWWLKQEDIPEIADKLGVIFAPSVMIGTIEEAIDKVKGSLKSDWGDFEAEGLVGRPMVDMLARSGSRIITKIKAKDFR